MFPTLVSLLVDYSCNTTYYIAVFIGKEILSLTEIKGRILVRRECVYLVAMQIGHIVFVASIQVVMELYESLQLLFVLDLYNFNF